MKKWKRLIAFILLIVVIGVTCEIPVSAVEVDTAGNGDFKPEQPTVTKSNNKIKITGVELVDNQVEISASARPLLTSYDFTLVLELLQDGGIHFYDKVNSNDVFQNEAASLRDTLTKSDITNGVCITGNISGVSAKLTYENKTWSTSWNLQIFKKDSQNPVYELCQDDILVKYTDSNRTSVSFIGDIASGEQFIGLGERYTDTILNGKSYPMWNEDGWSAGLNGDKTGSYVNVPLLHSNQGYSVFFNSFYSGNADIGESDKTQYRFDFDGGDLDLFVWTGTPLENLKSYASVTGTTVTVPKWAIGYWAGGDTASYWKSLAQAYYDKDAEKGEEAEVSDYYAQALREVLQNYQELGTLPKAIYTESLPTRKLEEVSEVCQEYGVKMLGWYHPDQPWDEDQYRMINASVLTGLRGFGQTESLPLIHTTDGEYYTYTNDGGTSEWNRVDYTHGSVGKLLTANLTRGWNQNLSGLMVDYGEYIKADWVFSNGMTGKEMHNMQAYYYNKAMNTAWENSSQAGDYVLFARAGSAGSQAYAAQFGGDQKCNFEGLRQAVMGGLSASASGFGIWGSDIGGLGIGTTKSDNNPILSAELYMRWLAFGTFSTLMRTHGTQKHDPWTFAEKVKAEGLNIEADEVFQKYYWTRENLTDAIYSATLQSHNDGTPVMQVMGLAYPEYFDVGDQYVFCNEMLVAPIYEMGNTSVKGVVKKSVTFPNGTWYDLWSGKEVEGSGKKVLMDVPVDEIPVYVKSGCVMPVTLSTKTYDIADSMTEGRAQALLITPAPDGESRTSAWQMNEESGDALTYTSETSGNQYTIRAGQSENNPMIVRGYGYDITFVSVDGVNLERLYHKPKSNETGFFLNEGTQELIVALADGNWSTLVLGESTKCTSLDVNFENIDVTTLTEMGFTSTQVGKSENQPVEEHWFSGNGEDTPYVTRKEEKGVNIWYSNKNVGIKPVTANKDSTITLLNTPFSEDNFELTMKVCYGYMTGVVLGPENEYPTSEQSAAVRIYFANGRIQLTGAVDLGTAAASVSGTYSKSGTIGCFLPINTLSANQYYTLHITMNQGLMKIWVEENAAILQIHVAQHYEAGNLALLAKKFDEDGGGICSLKITALTEMAVDFSNTNLEYLDKIGFSSTCFDRDNKYQLVGTADQGISTGWVKGTGIQANAKDTEKHTYFLNTPYYYDDFKASVKIHWGVGCGIAFGQENVCPFNTKDCASVHIWFANKRVQLSGALNYKTAQVIGKENGWNISGETGIFYFTDNFEPVGNQIYTLNVKKEGKLLTVWVEGYSGVLTIELAEHFESGRIALTANKKDGDGGGIRSFTIEKLRTQYVMYTAEEFKTYRETAEYTAPEKDDYLFAGWFRDMNGEQPVGSDIKELDSCVYAKFVPENLLTVKAQISENLLDNNSANDQKGDLRFVTTVDTLQYSQVGFHIVYEKGGETKNRTSASNVVYKRLYAVGSNQTQLICYQPSDICSAAAYFKACTVRNIGKENFDTIFSVTPFWKTSDGTYVCGKTVAKAVKQGIDSAK